MKFVQDRMKVFGIALVIIATSACVAEAKASIEGVVVDLYGQECERATIELRGEGLPKVGLTTTSDSNGHYQIRDLNAGDYELTILFRGFRREVVKVDLFADEVKRLVVGLEVGRVTDAVPIYISGTVQSERKPLADVIVTVTNAFNRRKSTTVKTDKQGRYKLKIFDGGQYIITAFRPGFEASVETRRFDSFPIDKPRTYHVNMSSIRFSGL